MSCQETALLSGRHSNGKSPYNSGMSFYVFSMWKSDEPLVSVDLFVEHPIEFDLLWSRAEVTDLGPLSVRIAAIPDLIALKRLANRPQDLIDIEKLTEIQKLKQHRDDE